MYTYMYINIMFTFTYYMTIFVYIYIYIYMYRCKQKSYFGPFGLAMVDLSSYGGQLCIMFGRIGGVTVTYCICNHQQPLKLGKSLDIHLN